MLFLYRLASEMFTSSFLHARLCTSHEHNISRKKELKANNATLMYWFSNIQSFNGFSYLFLGNRAFLQMKQMSAATYWISSSTFSQ